MEIEAQLLHRLRGCLSSDARTRQASEEFLLGSRNAPGYGALLGGVVLQTEAGADVRQLAAVLLNRHVAAHWQPAPGPQQGLETGAPTAAVLRPAGSEAPQGLEATGPLFVIPAEEKEAIRQRLLSAVLHADEKKVCASVCAALATIAASDWPERWPELVDRLLASAAVSSKPFCAAASLQCLGEVVEQVDEQRMPLLAHKILPQLLAVVSDPKGYGASVRAGALRTAHTCFASVATLRGPQQRKAAEVLGAALSSWMPQFLAILSRPLTTTDLPEWTVRAEALKCLTQAVLHFAPLLENLMAELLASLWQSWVSSIPAFEAVVISGLPESVPGPEGQEWSWAGEAGREEGVAVQTFEFVLELIRHPTMREHIRCTTEALVYFTISYMQMSREQEEEWLQDPNKFVADEDEELHNCRASGCLLIEELVAAFDETALVGISVAVQRRLLDSTSARSQGNTLWWKLREAAILAVGTVADKFIGSEMSGRKLFDSQAFMDMLVVHDLGPGGAADLPLLSSRCLWAAGRFCPVAGTTERLSAILTIASSSLSVSRPAAVRVGACRALARIIPNSPHNLLLQFVGPIYGGISALLPQMSDESLHLALELLETIVRAGKQATVQVEAGLTPAVLSLWANNVTDPVISCDACDVLEAVADTPDCLGPLLAKALPFLQDILSKPSVQPEGLVAGALDLLTMLLKRCPPELLQQHFEAVLSPVAALVLSSSDHSELQNGSEVLAVLVRVGSGQLLQWGPDPDATMKKLLDCASKLLAPDLDPSAALFVGPFLEQLLAHLPSHMGPHLQALVRALITRMAANSTPVLSTSLLLVFARLIHACSRTERQQLLDTLAAIPVEGSSGSGLALLGTLWCDLHGEVKGRQRMAMAASALALLLGTQDPRLEAILVQGKRGAAPVAPMPSSPRPLPPRARSKPRAPMPDHRALVPVTAKGLTFIAEALAAAAEAEEDGTPAGTPSHLLHSHQGGGGGGAEQEVEDDDDDILDPNELHSLIRYGESDDGASDDGGPDDPLDQADLVHILREYVVGFAESNRRTLIVYRDIFSEAQARVLQSLMP